MADKTALDKLRAMCDDATPGTWKWKSDFAYLYLGGNFHAAPIKIDTEDMHFIATARTALPALLDLVEALEWEMEVFAFVVSGLPVFNEDSPGESFFVEHVSARGIEEIEATSTAATAAVEAARQKLEGVCRV